MKSRVIAGLLLLLLMLSAVSGCSAPLLGRPKLLPMPWNGTALTGASFHERRLPLVTVHYADPTRPADAEQLGATLQKFLAKNRAFGRFGQGDRLDVWVVPDGYAWPEEVWIDNLRRSVQAVKPRVVILTDRFIPRALSRDERLDNNKVLQLEAAETEIYRAVATAVTQGPASAAYRIGWIHDGMGGLFLRDYIQFPGAYVTVNFKDSFSPRLRSWDGQRVVYELERSGAYRYQVAAALAAIMADRFGLDWPVEQVAPGTAFPPFLALRTLAKLSNPKVSNPRSVYQEADHILVSPLSRTVSLGDRANRLEPVAQVDGGINRRKPQEGPKSTVSPNLSPLSYRFDLRWDAAAHTVAGEEQLTWTNGEGVPVDRLYFNVWGNSTRSLWYGGQTTVEAVSVAGNSVPFTFKGMDLEVPLSRSVGPGETVRLTIHFATRLPTVPPGAETRLKPWEPPTVTWKLELWYPALAVLDQKGWQLDSFPENGLINGEPANYSVRITVPPGSEVRSAQEGRRTPGDGGATVYEFEAKSAPEWTGEVLVTPGTGE